MCLNITSEVRLLKMKRLVSAPSHGVTSGCDSFSGPKRLHQCSFSISEYASGLDKEVAGRISGPTQTSSSDAKSCLVESEVITIEGVQESVCKPIPSDSDDTSSLQAATMTSVSTYCISSINRLRLNFFFSFCRYTVKMGCYGTPLPWCFGTPSYVVV